MDYSNIIKELDEASLFDIYRLSCALNQELSNDKRVNEVKSKLVVGQEISWFNVQSNKEEKAKVLKCNKSRVLVHNFSDNQKWNVFYSAINTQAVAVDITINQKIGLRKIELSLGEVVAFLDRYNKTLYGQVVKLNPKTARIDVGADTWDVSYNLLRKTNDIEAELALEAFLIYEETVDL